VAIALLASGIPVSALGSSLSEGLKTGWDGWRKNHRDRKEAQAAAKQPGPDAVAEADPRFAAIEQRLASLEASNAELRMNNAAVLADHALLREQNTALQQSNHAVRTQNVDLYQENTELKGTVKGLWDVVQAHSVLLKNQKEQLDSHSGSLATQGQSIARHESTLAGHGEALFTHEESLRHLRQPPPPSPGTQFPADAGPVDPDSYVDTSQASTLFGQANEALAKAKQWPGADSKKPGVDPNYYTTPNTDPNSGPKR
jgi:hypothetical protein